jgi:hypothetical protein
MKIISSGIGVAAAKNAAAAPYFFTNLSKGFILVLVFGFKILRPLKLRKNIICFATVALIAETKASICKSYSEPTDIVASSKNPGRGTNGINEPMKLTSARIKYPSSGANGKMSVNSINQMKIRRYLFKTNSKKSK